MMIMMMLMMMMMMMTMTMMMRMMMMISIMRPYDFEYNTGDNEDGLSIWSYMSTCVKLPSKLWSKSSTVSLKNISQILVIMIMFHKQEGTLLAEILMMTLVEGRHG